MRRVLVLLLLLGGMQLIRPLGANAPSSEALLAFGFLILAAYTVGEIVSAVKLPKLVGYLLAGIVFGPSALGTVTHDVILRLGPVNQLAVALIAFLAGAELKWAEIRLRGGSYAKVIATEMPIAFIVLFGTLLALRSYLPAVSDRPFEAAIVFALLFASILIAHSPAVAFGVLKETGAKGPLARSALGVILLSDVVLIVVFSLAVAAARAIIPPPGAEHAASVLTVFWEIGGALIVGAAIGAVVALYLRFTQRELLLFGLIVAMFGAEIARIAHVELLLTLLTAGFVMENLSRDDSGEKLRHAVERAAAPVFVVFFALAGASIHLAEVISLFYLVAPIALIRAIAIWMGAGLGSRWARMSPVERRYLWMGLVSQSGVAIGLATVVAVAYPELGTAVRTFALAVIALNELVGPILFKRALTAAGEVESESAELGGVGVVAGAPGREE